MLNISCIKNPSMQGYNFFQKSNHKDTTVARLTAVDNVEPKNMKQTRYHQLRLHLDHHEHHHRTFLLQLMLNLILPWIDSPTLGRSPNIWSQKQGQKLHLNNVWSLLRHFFELKINLYPPLEVPLRRTEKRFQRDSKPVLVVVSLLAMKLSVSLLYNFYWGWAVPSSE